MHVCVMGYVYIHVCMHVETREQQTGSIIGLELAQQARLVAMEPRDPPVSSSLEALLCRVCALNFKVPCAFKKIIYFTYVHVHVHECVCMCEGQRKISGVSPQRPPCFDRVSVVCCF